MFRLEFGGIFQSIPAQTSATLRGVELASIDWKIPPNSSRKVFLLKRAAKRIRGFHVFLQLFPEYAESFRHILKIAFVIPRKNFGILKITTFIIILHSAAVQQPTDYSKCTAYFHYHLNKHKYPNVMSKIISMTATTATGKNKPATIPKQKDSALKPTAFAQPLIQKSTIAHHFQLCSILYYMWYALSLLLFYLKI